MPEAPHRRGDEMGCCVGVPVRQPRRRRHLYGGAEGGRTEYRNALPQAEVGAALQMVRESGACRDLVHAFEFLVLTATHSGEVRADR